MPETKSPKIERLAVQLFYDCGQRCVFCSERETIARYRRAPIGDREIVRAMATARRGGAGTMFFAGGGEPTMHPRFLALLKASKDLGYKTFIITDGRLLADPVFASRALPMLDEVCLSVHGHTAGLHDGLTRVPGSFERMLRAFVHVRANPGTALMTNTVVCRRNWDAMEDIVGFLAGQRTRVCRLAQMAPEGRGALRYAERVVPHDAWRAKVPALARLARRKRVRLLFDGLPMCALGADRGRSADLERIPTVWVRRSSELGGVKIEEERLAETRYRFKPPVCGGCADTGVCGGVFQPYALAFGAADLDPRRAGEAMTRDDRSQG